MKKIISILIATTLIGLFVLSVIRVFRQGPHASEALIAQHVQELKTILEEIDKECEIVEFEHQINHIDFLTVTSFVGSEVGSMVLARPHGWKGPYLQQTLTIQQRPYIVVRTTKGYFITPGIGVQLAHGKTLGNDIILDEQADILALTQKGEPLEAQGKPLAVQLTLHNHVPALLTGMSQAEE